MFATLNLERDPLKLSDTLRGLAGWVQDAGGFSLLLLVILMIWARARWPGGLSVWLWGAPNPERPRRWVPDLFRWCLRGAALGYGAAALLSGPKLRRMFAAGQERAELTGTAATLARYGGWALTFGAACALLAVCLPFFVNLLALRWRRIWGVARLSFKEAIRGKVLYVCSAMVLVLLFLNWFVPSKRETQLQTYVTIVYAALTPLMLVSAGLIASFGIPTDIRQQTIHTVVTKPVERFELVLGRFLGYTLLMSAVLLVLTTLCLGYVLRIGVGINPEAKAESLKARVPLYGELHFQKISNAYTNREGIEEVKRDDRELNVGREWDYHRYIPGVNPDKETGAILQAVWYYDDLPRVLTRRSRVRCEYKFDIYRQTKGKENEEVRCSFFYHTRNFDPASNNRTEYDEARKTLLALRRPDTESERRKQENIVRKLLPGFSDEVVSRLSAGKMRPDEINDLLAEQFGYHEVRSAKVVDYHTFHVDLPAGLFRNALRGPPGGGATAREGEPLLTVRVRCESPSQFLGMARYDVYFR